MKEPSIFISYSRADRPFTRELAKRLRRAYMEVWYDDKLHGGEVWWEEILAGIRKCDVFVYLVSHDSLKSTYCQAELAEARRLHKLVLPVQIRRIYEDIPDTLREIQVVDMTEGLTADTVTDLLAALMRLARRITPAYELPTSPVPVPMPIFVYRTNTHGIKKVVAWFLRLRESVKQQNWKRRFKVVMGMSAVSMLALVMLALFLSWDNRAHEATAEDAFPPVENVTNTRVDTRGVTQVFVPAGCFVMGSNPATDFLAELDEQPAHEVCFEEGFWIDKTEVTNAQYETFLEENPYLNQQYWTREGWEWLIETRVTSPADYRHYLAPHQPRVGVNWYEALAFATWRGGRLCSEAEWEYAARGQNSSLYPWGSAFSSTKMIYEGNSNGRSVNVGSISEGASWVGALDMTGNVAEWTSDWYVANAYEHPTLPQAPVDKTIRGGSWSTGKIENLRAAYRDWLNPVFRRANVGFRVCS